jgi:selenocysteine lyase/cysteine desulfurase/tRNA(Ile)-lysidine synthase TilS/MesJ
MAAIRRPIDQMLQDSLSSSNLELVITEKGLLGQNRSKLLKYIHDNVIGDYSLLPTPYGKRPLVYADYIASGRTLKFIEDYIFNVVLPNYSNTHTSTSWVGVQTTYFRQEARNIIKRCINASEQDLILFTGSGTTSAVNKLVQILKRSFWGSQKSYFQSNRWGSVDCLLCSMSFSTQGKYIKHLKSSTHTKNLPKSSDSHEEEVPVVFLSIFEHHSNLLPWREAGAEVVMIHDTASGRLDLESLESHLKKYQHRKYKIGSFIAGSNINGILTDVKAVTRLLKSYGALSFFDYATAAPYVPIDMNPSSEEAIDGLFFSGHKFVGGPGCPGVLAMKKMIVGNEVPIEPGGGTIFFVDETNHTYIFNPEEREEGGTPDIIGSIKLGLVFQLKEAVSDDFIYNIELQKAKAITERLQSINNLVLLGNPDLEHLPVFSFLVTCGSRFFHHSFIAALMNDLFGIECRGGCACAGPYALKLLGIDSAKALEIENTLKEGYDLFRPGFVRISFNYFLPEETIDYIITAINFISENAIWFLPQYKFDMEKTVFEHREYSTKEGRHKSRKWLNEITYAQGECEYPRYSSEKDLDLNKYIELAHKILQEIKGHRYIHSKIFDNLLEVPSDLEHLRWFVLPSEAMTYIQSQSINFFTAVSPFYPVKYTKQPESTLPQIAPIPKPQPKHPLYPIIPKKLIKKVLAAVNDYDMIHDNDKIIVCISGGKDSLTMLHLLRHIQKVSAKKFKIAAATVDPQVPEYNPSPLKEYMEYLGIPYFYESHAIVSLAAAKMTKKVSLCAFCSRMKRGILYSCARREGYNVLALGQHLDDLAESFLMSIFNNGMLRTMKANYVNDKGDLRIIRPLVYVREKVTKAFAQDSKLPVITENCPACFAAPTERHRTKLMLASQEQAIPDVFSSILSAMKPIMRGGLDLAVGKRPRDEEDKEEDCEQCVFNPV